MSEFLSDICNSIISYWLSYFSVPTKASVLIWHMMCKCYMWKFWMWILPCICTVYKLLLLVYPSKQRCLVCLSLYVWYFIIKGVHTLTSCALVGVLPSSFLIVNSILPDGEYSIQTWNRCIYEFQKRSPAVCHNLHLSPPPLFFFSC